MNIAKFSALLGATIAAVSSSSSHLAFAGEPDSGNALVAVCNNPVDGRFDNPGILIYNEGTRGAPLLVAVEIWRNLQGPRKGWTDNANVRDLKATVVPQEEIHFSKPGFELEILTERQSWEPIYAESGRAIHSETKPGHLKATILGNEVDAEMACTIYFY